MTPSSRTTRPRLRLAAVAAVATAAVGLLATAGLGEALVYYRTPQEVADLLPGPEERLRVGGLVTAGSVARSGGQTAFTLTDGVGALRVRYAGEPPGVFTEGQGAVVEGRLGADGVLVADAVLVKHSNEYAPPTASASP